MKGLRLEAHWDPRPVVVATLDPRDVAARVARRGNQVWRNPLITLAEVPDPAPTADQVIVRVGACGICGSDLHFVEPDVDGYMLYPGLVRAPVTTGHEFAGVVEAVGGARGARPPGECLTFHERVVNTGGYPRSWMARTILVVEDEPTLRETLVDALEADGFRVVAAADGREALTQFRSERPDLVLLDLMLPELSGIEVTRIIRSESGVPIVMLTAKNSELDKVVGLELGADDYVTKPFSLRELTARIRALFRRAEAAVAVGALPAVIDLGRVQADLAGHRLMRDGETLPIKPKAFELLAFLIRHPGQVFTRDQLLEHVWGYDYGGETRTVDVHVHWLRSQIEDDPGTPAFIHTVRGVGYVFRRPT